MSDYEPIDCHLYDELESLAVRKVVCDIEFEATDGQREQISSLIQDVFAREKQEFIQVGDGILIRLDRVRRINGKTIHPGSCQGHPGKQPADGKQAP